MNRIIAKTISCFMLGAVIVGLQAFADDSVQRKTIYKFKYNNVPLKQPVVTQSMKPAVAEFNKGNYLGAMVDLKKVVENEPDNTYAKYYLALCYTYLGYKNEAQGLYQEIAMGNSSYALKYYSERAACIENPTGEFCKPPKKIKAPNIIEPKEPKSEESSLASKENATDQEHQEDDEITKFIKSGKKIHPAVLDRISRERADRQMQENVYRKQQAELENQNQNQ